jgi:hypothetical protein
MADIKLTGVFDLIEPVAGQPGLRRYAIHGFTSEPVQPKSSPIDPPIHQVDGVLVVDIRETDTVIESQIRSAIAAAANEQIEGGPYTEADVRGIHL